MRYELNLIKRKAFSILNSIKDQEDPNYTIKDNTADIVRLANACIKAVNDVDNDITDIALTMRRVTTDIK